jgi:DNA-3-methyladenine glycosylase I
MAQVPAETELSRKISKELARRAFKFCGPTIVYAFMQAVGMVNDHLVTCHRHSECIKLGLPSPLPLRGRSTPKAAGGG